MIVLLVLVVLAVALVYMPYRRDIQAAYQRLESIERQTIPTECGPIEVAVRGAGEPVLISHGISGGYDQALGLADAHLSAGMMAIAPSRFGYLGTPLPADASPAAQADAYACLLDALGLQRVTLLANSAGGASAVQMALRHPDRLNALVLVSAVSPAVEAPVALPPRPVIEAVFGSDFIMWLLTTRFPTALHQTVGVPKGFPLSGSDEVLVRELIRSILPIRPRQAGFVFDMFTSNLDMDEHPQAYPLEEIRVPTLLINAADDPLVKYANATSMAARIPGAQLMTLASGGHLLLNSGAEVPEAIERFVLDHAAGP